MKNKPYVIVRTRSAGVHAGYLFKRKGREVLLVNSRRIWGWDGACSVSQMSLDGVQEPEKSYFTMTVPKILLLEAVEILECTEQAEKSIKEVPVWRYCKKCNEGENMHCKCDAFCCLGVPNMSGNADGHGTPYGESDVFCCDSSCGSCDKDGNNLDAARDGDGDVFGKEEALTDGDKIVSEEDLFNSKKGWGQS